MVVPPYVKVSATPPVVVMGVPVAPGTAVVPPPLKENVGAVKANPASAKSTVTEPQWLTEAEAGVSTVTVPTLAEAVDSTTTVSPPPDVGTTTAVRGSKTSVVGAVWYTNIQLPKSISAVFATVIALFDVNVTGTFAVVCAKAPLVAIVEPRAIAPAHANSLRVLRLI